MDTPRQSVSPARDRQLKSLKPDGTAYKRWADIEAEIQRVLELHQSHWFAELKDLQGETLVFLARYVRQGYPALYGPLLREITSRAFNQANHSIYGLDETTQEYIAVQVETDIMRLTMAEEPIVISSIERRILVPMRMQDGGGERSGGAGIPQLFARWR